VHVAGADFGKTKTTGARASDVDWSRAKVPLAEVPEPLPVPPWLPALVAGIGLLIIVVIVLAKKRRLAPAARTKEGQRCSKESGDSLVHSNQSHSLSPSGGWLAWDTTSGLEYNEWSHPGQFVLFSDCRSVVGADQHPGELAPNKEG
jgi:hypothetical protein